MVTYSPPLAGEGQGWGVRKCPNRYIKIGYDSVYILHPCPSSQEEGS